MSKVDISNRYLEEEEVRTNKLPYFDYFQCVDKTFSSISSFCDIGCATGHLIYFLKTKYPSIDVKGYEYFAYHKDSTFCESNIKNNIEIYDIRDSLPDSVPMYDVVNCTEVAEHIEAAYADTLIENAKKLSKKYIIFTWSSHGGDQHPESDPHHQHLNPLSRQVYIDLMKKHGLRENIELTNRFLQLSYTMPHFYFWWRESFIVWEKI
jgi:hypothetical protein